MSNHEKFLPDHSSDLTGRRVIVLAAHPKDEIMGCGGSMVLHSDCGDPVKVIFFTDGFEIDSFDTDSSDKLDKNSSVSKIQGKAIRACECLGVTDLELWSYKTGGIFGAHGILKQMIDLFKEFKPDLVYAPSPLGYDGDHRAVARLLQDALKNLILDFDVAFYEADQPLCINTLVNITDVIDRKLKAFDYYEVNTKKRPNSDIGIALNMLRSLFLSEEGTHAEGFALWKASAIKTIGVSSVICHAINKFCLNSYISGPLVSIIVRTKNRPKQLAQAINSIVEQTYRNIEIIVVNDGGEDTKTMVTKLAGDIPLTYIHCDKSKGRPSAANTGLKAANGVYINFLDDDDVFDPCHLENLVPFIEASSFQAVYSDCELCRYIWDGHEYVLKDKALFMSVDFDADRLLFENYIPCMNMLFKKTLYEQIGIMDKELEIYEDWDYWIRMSRVTTLRHLKTITAQYRIYDQGTVGTSGRDYDTWHWTKKIYEKYQTLWSPDVLIGYFRHTIANRIGDLHHEIENVRAILYEKESIIESHLKCIEQKEQIIKENRNTIEQNKLKISQMHHNTTLQLNILKTHMEQRGKELTEIKKTISWRITKPLRIIRAYHIKQQLKFIKIKNYARKIINFLKNDKSEEEYEQWLINNEPSSNDLNAMKEDAKELKLQPLISVILPVYKISPKWLKKAIESVRSQIYTNWELCIVDDASFDLKIRDLLEAYNKLDSRIKVVFLKKNNHISGASNEALKLAEGEFIALLDHDDEFAPHALFEIAKLLNEHPDADMIYSDEDHINLQGKRVNPHFKPDWSPDLFLSQMYTCHLGCYRRELVSKIGGFRIGYEGSQDYDLVLRIMAHTNKIFHIPKILYHWRMVPTSVAGNPTAKNYADEAALKAINDYLSVNNINAVAEKGLFKFSYKINYAIINQPVVTIIIPMRDQVYYLKRLVYSILYKSDYPYYQIVIVNNQSAEEATFKYFHELADESRIKILDYPFPFNYSAINNFAAKQSNGDIFLFLNNDMEVINKDWLGQMVQHAQRPEIGVVGARLYYPDNGGIQHAGIIIGIGGYAGHAHQRMPVDSPGYFGRVKLIQNFSAVTGACLMTRKDVFSDVGGFNENELKIAANDVDYCLRVREKGLRVLYTPFAELIHYESISRGYEDTPEKIERFNREKAYFAKRWVDILSSGDPYYNSNLTLDKDDFSLGTFTK